MLQAKTKEGKLITLASLTENEIDLYRQSSPFYCPSCKEQVMMKAGSKMIPHFAHYSKVNCPSHEGGEGPYHEEGKHHLYQWLRNQRIPVTLEEYLPDINQRPDLLLTINQKRVAIEFQCARIPSGQMKKRNAGYKQAGITPIWIIGANHFKRIHTHHLKMDQFLRQFLHQFSPGFPLTLFFFSPSTLQFTTFQDIHLTKSQRALGKLNITLLENILFKEIFSERRFRQQELYQFWRKEKRNFRLRVRNKLFGRELTWYQWLYLKHTHIEQLPSIIHLPVSAQYLFRTPTWDWQSRLCLEVIHPLAIGASFLLKSCVKLLRSHLISPANFPLVHSNEHPIKQYLEILEKLRIVKKISPTRFIKISTLTFHQNIEQALHADDTIINTLITQNSNKIQA